MKRKWHAFQCLISHETYRALLRLSTKRTLKSGHRVSLNEIVRLAVGEYLARHKS